MATVNIIVGSNDWINRAYRAINSKKRINLVLKGIEASTLWTAIQRTVNPHREVAVAITAAIVIGVIAALGMGVLAAVCMYGMNRGYTVKAKHKVKGPLPFDDELSFELYPPKR
ncbi:MAG TPA: hypothetical protein VG961_01325 [Ignavibacteria bacterium]|nr:hypothetical protein [Ignavibacteria bacterium]